MNRFDDLEEVEDKIKKLFRMNLTADYHAISMTILDQGGTISPQIQLRIDKLDRYQAGKNALYSVLSENEKIVIQRHFVDGLDWDCVGAEFAQKWGPESQKSKRSLINYMNRAFRKMAEYVQENAHDFSFDWLLDL